MTPSVVSLLCYLSNSLPVSVYCRFFCSSNLFAIFYNRGRLYTSATTHSARKGGTRKSRTKSAHISKATSKEVIIVKEPTTHAEWIHSLLLLPLTIILVTLSISSERISKKVVVIVTEKAGKRIASTKSSSENLISFSKTESRTHVEVSETSTHISEASVVASRCCRWVKSFLSIFVENFSLLFVR